MLPYVYLSDQLHIQITFKFDSNRVKPCFLDGTIQLNRWPNVAAFLSVAKDGLRLASALQTTTVSCSGEHIAPSHASCACSA